MDIYLLTLWIPLVAGFLLDRLLGDPPFLPHPVVGFGKLIAFSERKWNKGKYRKAKGTLAACLLITGTFAVNALLLNLCFTWNRWAGIAVSAVGVFYCLAGKTLADEVRMVFQAADRSLEEGRKQVSRIVGRDTKALTDQEVRTAALETLAENLSDGVIAPLFWYLLLGLPGMMTYKMINTLDSMIGYKNKRYKDFGCFAAHTDDAANYLPARLTALLMAIVAGRRSLLPFIKKYGRRHASPNSGFPEAALAGILDCRFGGPHDYFGETVYKPYIGTNNRPLNGGDMQRAIAVNRRSETAMLLLITAVYLLIFLFYLSIRGSGIDSGLFQ